MVNAMNALTKCRQVIGKYVVELKLPPTVFPNAKKFQSEWIETAETIKIKQSKIFSRQKPFFISYFLLPVFSQDEHVKRFRNPRKDLQQCKRECISSTRT